MFFNIPKFKKRFYRDCEPYSERGHIGNSRANSTRFPEPPDPHCFLCGSTMTKRTYVTLVVLPNRVCREVVCESCQKQLPTPTVRKATPEEEDNFLNRFMNARFGEL